LKRLISALFARLGANTPEERRALVLQFVKFGLVGVSNTLVSWAVYYLFLWLNEDLYMAGTVAGTVVSIYNAFFWNDRFVFKGGDRDRKSRLKRLGKTYVSYGFTSLLSIALVWAEVNLLGISKALAPIVTLVVTIPLNFLINKLWTFGKMEKE
jgi:putative flippase GtrA